QVGAVGARLPELVGADNEVLAEHGDLHGPPDRGQVVKRPAEPALLGQHADHPGAAGLVVARERGRVVDVGHRAAGRTRPLDLRDDTDALGLERGHGVQRRRGFSRHVLQLLKRDARLALGQVGPHPFEDLVEHTHRGSAVSSNRKCCATDASPRRNAVPGTPRKFAFAMHWAYVHVARRARYALASSVALGSCSPVLPSPVLFTVPSSSVGSSPAFSDSHIVAASRGRELAGAPGRVRSAPLVPGASYLADITGQSMPRSAVARPARKTSSAPMKTATCHGVPVMIAWPVDPETTKDPPDIAPLVVDPAVPEMAADSGEATLDATTETTVAAVTEVVTAAPVPAPN